MILEVTVFRGYGPFSQGVLRNVVKAAEELRNQGYIVVINEVTVPALDVEDGFTPFIMINGVELYIPSVDVDEKVLAEYIAETITAYENMLGLPAPPLAETMD